MTSDRSNTAEHDVRMRGFRTRATVDEALAWLDAQLVTLPSESVTATAAAGRVLAADVTSAVDLPGFDRAMMDGYALHAEDTQGASAYNPLSLEVVGRVLPGQDSAPTLQRGQASEIMTGAPLPSGADAVLPAELAEASGDRITAVAPVSPGKHVGRRGEDILRGSKVLGNGRCLRPQDLGLLSSIGTRKVDVHRRPRVRILVTGNELLPPGSTPLGYRIADANGPMLSALTRRDGGQLVGCDLIADEPDKLLPAMRADADVVLVSGGSSVGREDHAPMLLADQGELAIHGVAMRPSSPTGMGKIGPALVFLLPGNPVSCLCAYDFFAGRALRALGGLPRDWPHRRVILPLSEKLVSAVGRVDYARVKISAEHAAPLAVSGASILSSTTRADGFVIVPMDLEGYPAGADVEVLLYD